MILSGYNKINLNSIFKTLSFLKLNLNCLISVIYNDGLLLPFLLGSIVISVIILRHIFLDAIDMATAGAMDLLATWGLSDKMHDDLYIRLTKQALKIEGKI